MNSAPSLPAIHAIEEAIGAQSQRDGYCTACLAITPQTVFGGAMLGIYPNLREGMVCQCCGLNSRSRMLLLAGEAAIGRTDGRVVLLEALSPLAAAARRRWSNLLLSEYAGPDVAPGALVDFAHVTGQQTMIRHEDLLRLSFEDGSVAALIHNDVLEHVSDVGAACRQMYRVLQPGGMAVFTMPWFPWLQSTVVRGRVREDGTREDFLPPEYHGDRLRSDGIYTYYNFGADFGRWLLEAGFAELRFGVCYSPSCGFVSNNYRYGMEGFMMPSVILARKSA